MGAGWFEREHEAFGLDFGASMGDRLDRLGEAVEICRRLLDGERFDFEGRFYSLRDVLVAPRPVQAHLPILVGGSGPRKTLPLVARWADQWNAYSTPETYAAKAARLDELCRDIGRDASSIRRSLNVNALVRSSDEEAATVWAGYVEAHRPWDDEERQAIAGSIGTVTARLAEYEALGIDEIVWVFRVPWDLETIEALPSIRDRLGV
jgi:alkanesulfonate monooxygenase SsuD/methylene tetrahydromethanopterin reductase-like flavin-dependent oxidoreductase (luciferase family)